MSSQADKTKDPLIQSSGLEIYRRNVFRITGLPADATARHITKRAEQLKLAGALGHAQNAEFNELSIRPSPSAEQIQEALQRIKEPELRVIDEYFWYWPMHEAGSGEDPAIRALQDGKVHDALRIWTEKENDRVCGAIASHNLAVFDHMVAIDWTLNQLADPTNLEAALRAERYWEQSMERWERIATDSSTWDWLKNRIRVINDPRLTTGLARRMEMGLPEALDKINAEAALRFAESGDIDTARMHIRIMEKSHQGLDDVEATAEMVLMPLRHRIEQRISHAQKAANTDGKSAAVIAQGLLNECIPMMSLFDLFHGDSHHKTELFDEVAETANRLGVIYQKATDRNEGLVGLLNHAMTCASDDDLKSRIQENIRLIEGNLKFEKLLPVIEAIKKLTDSKVTPSERLKQMKQRIIPLATPFLKERVGDKTLSDLLASTLRSISIDAFNQSEDIATAQKAICLAGDYARDGKIKQQIAKDRGLVEERLRISLCVHCNERMGDQDYNHEISMYGDVRSDNSLGYGRIQYRSGKFTVPRCNLCAKKHKKVLTEGNMTWLLLSIVGFIAGLFIMINIGAGGFWIIVIGFVVGLICKASISAPAAAAYRKALKHPNVDELLSQGWKFGDEPPQH